MALRPDQPDRECPAAAVVGQDNQERAERQITTFNIASITNPLSSPQGLTEVARMLADGTITVRINSTIQPDHIGEVREKLRNGGLHGKVVIRF